MAWFEEFLNIRIQIIQGDLHENFGNEQTYIQTPGVRRS